MSEGSRDVPSAVPMHERDPHGRFSSRVEDYVRYRPTYPRAAIDAMLEGLKPADDAAGLVAADVGAGTGISSRMLAERGVRVLAVEPNAAMRAAAGEHPLITQVDAAAERTGLADRSVDLVLAAQAFHWFRQEEALVEFHRILRPSGRLALMWNDDDPGDAVTRAYRAAVLEAAARDWPQNNPFTAEDLAARGPFVNVRSLVFSHAQALDEDGLVGRARSASYVPKSGERWERLERSLRAVYRTHADAEGRVWLRYRTQVYVAEPRMER